MVGFRWAWTRVLNIRTCVEDVKGKGREGETSFFSLANSFRVCSWSFARSSGSCLSWKHPIETRGWDAWTKDATAGIIKQTSPSLYTYISEFILKVNKFIINNDNKFVCIRIKAQNMKNEWVASILPVVQNEQRKAFLNLANQIELKIRLLSLSFPCAREKNVKTHLARWSGQELQKGEGGGGVATPFGVEVALRHGFAFGGSYK